MKFSLLPKENVFYRLLEDLASKTEESVTCFVNLISNWAPTHPDIQKLRDLEHQCDRIVHDIMVKLNKTFVTPIDREDIHLLCKHIDDLVDIVHALIERMVLFQIQSVKKDLIETAHILLEATSLIVTVVKKISKMKNPQDIFNDCIHINTLENKGDRAFEKALGDLFSKEKDPLEVLKWKEIFDLLERSIDKCEDIADNIWGIVVKYG